MSDAPAHFVIYTNLGIGEFSEVVHPYVSQVLALVASNYEHAVQGLYRSVTPAFTWLGVSGLLSWCTNIAFVGSIQVEHCRS